MRPCFPLEFLAWNPQQDANLYTVDCQHIHKHNLYEESSEPEVRNPIDKDSKQLCQCSTLAAGKQSSNTDGDVFVAVSALQWESVRRMAFAGAFCLAAGCKHSSVGLLC